MTTKDNPVSVRLPADVRAWLERKAKDEERSISSQVVYLLRREMEREAAAASERTG